SRRPPISTPFPYTTLFRSNQALLLQLRTQQDANQINANLSLQQIVAQKQQQDAMKSAFRDSAGYENYYNANITPTSSGSANLLRSEEHTSELQSPCNLVCR